MTEEKSTEQEVVKTEETSTEVKPEQNMIPQSRFNEVIASKKELEDTVANLNAKLKQFNEDKLAAEGKKDELIENLKAERDQFKAQADQWTQYEGTRRKALIEQIPEDDRDIYEGLPLDKLEKAVGKITSGMNLDVDGSQAHSDSDAMGFKDITEAALARRNNQIDDKQYGKIRQYFINKSRR